MMDAMLLLSGFVTLAVGAAVAYIVWYEILTNEE